ncbi:hypothetical protein B0J12DRAFT_758392 [Macrophomina phaseolina]|uniref:Uncharacterized protein n=1 Tax=Macrophomina phaseolina TaxID=35725 RepID=A0ABQ8GRT9_9PEZI|nr:hypothetical protein B0J12DRAFT_758392 [Macrophomina phaseolina]
MFPARRACWAQPPGHGAIGAALWRFAIAQPGGPSQSLASRTVHLASDLSDLAGPLPRKGVSIEVACSAPRASWRVPAAAMRNRGSVPCHAGDYFGDQSRSVASKFHRRPGRLSPIPQGRAPFEHLGGEHLLRELTDAAIKLSVGLESRGDSSSIALRPTAPFSRPSLDQSHFCPPPAGTLQTAPRPCSASASASAPASPLRLSRHKVGPVVPPSANPFRSVRP